MPAAGDRRIVICCDGTGQTIRAARPPSRNRQAADSVNSAQKSNVLRLFDLLEKDSDDQIAYYDPGIGTLPGFEREASCLRRVRNVRDEWLGTGLMDNVGEAYRFLMDCYEPGDRVFLFGFSRGAFTVRALAGLLRSVGLLRKGNEALLPYARSVVDTMAERHRQLGWHDREAHDPLSLEFQKYTRPDRVSIAFLGVWDTVKAYGYLNPKGFPFQRNNDLIEVSRQAASIDEQRPPFQVTGLSDRRLRQSGLDEEAISHRVQEVWFAGDHSDVGGGHDGSNILAKAPFDWMLIEAWAEGLVIDAERYEEATGWAPAAIAPLDEPVHNLNTGAKAMVFGAPWRDLDNTHFPPDRHWRVGRDGHRRLVDHTFPDPVWRKGQGDGESVRPFMWLHDAVLERYQQGIHQPDNLRELFDSPTRIELLATPIVNI